jgi:3-oxoacyl-[acyl-carrier protein] reductase
MTHPPTSEPPGTLIVTGGSTGIGRATAARFLREGWRVFSLARRACPDSGVTCVLVDFLAPGFEDQVRREVIEPLGGQGGRVCVVHNAATLLKDNALDLDPASLRRVLELNVVVPATLNRLLSPLLVPGSSVLFVGSTLAEKAVAGTASYVTSKHALVGLMRATAQDLHGRGVHTLCVCPGFVDTEMLRAHVGNNAGVLTALGGMSTFGRLIQPEEIAEVLWAAAGQPVLAGAVVHANLGQVEH